MNAARNRFVVGSILVLALVALAIWAWRDGQPAIAGPAPVPTTTTTEAAAVPASGAVSAEPPATERAEVDAPPPPPAADPLLAHVRGRCVDENGAPLAACTVKLDAFGRNQDAMALQGKADWKDPEPVVTREDGRFDFGFAPPSGMQFGLDVATAGRVPRTGRWGRIQPAQVIDLGDIALRPGFEVRGRVVDEQGVPVAKAGVSLRNLPLPIAPDMAANDTRYGFSAANGEFRVEVPIPTGAWSLDVDSRGMRLVSPDRVVIGEHGAEPVVVVVRRMPSIEGIVVDDQAQPVQGVTVRAELNRSGRMASGRSRKDGTFTIWAVDAEPKPVALRIDDPGPCEPPPADPRLWDWGSKDVRFALRRAVSCELIVAERGTGAPVTRYAVICYHEKANSSLQRNLRLSGDHEGGRVTIDRVWRGKNFLQVMPLDQALLPSSVVEFDASDAGVPSMRIEIDRLRDATVRVTTAAGSPLQGSKVEVVLKGSRPFGADDQVQDSRSGNRGWSSDPKHRFHELVSAATTGADGRAPVFVPSDPGGLLVRVTGQHAVAIVDPATFVAGQDLVVVVPEGGGLTGKVLVTDLDRTQIEVQLRLQAEQDRSRNKTTKLDPAGGFGFAGLAPGTYTLQIVYCVPFRGEGWGTSSQMPLGVTVPPIAIAAGQTADVQVDATAIVPATVRGRVLLDGAPPASARVVLAAEGGANFGQFVPAADGSFEAPGLLPGTYRTNLVVGDLQASHGETIRGDDVFALAAGQRLERNFLFVRRRLVIRLLQADGTTPAASVQCSVHGEGFWTDKTTDKDGKFVLDPSPAVELRIQPMSGRVALGPVQIPAGQSTHEVTLTLPPTGKK